MNKKRIQTSSFAVAALAAILMGPAAAQAAVITLVPSTATPGAGSNFSIQVQVTGVFDAPHDIGDELFGFGFDVTAGSGVTYLGFTTGPLFDPLMLAGTDVAGITIAPSITPPAVEPLLLATLNFLAVTPGATLVTISSDYQNNLNEGLQYLSASDVLEGRTIINVGSAVVPEPGTMLMAGLGLGLAGVYFRKR